MDFFGWLMMAPVAASLAGLLWLAATGSRRALAVTLVISLAGLLQWGWIAWEFRDGLLFGPRTSDGLTALQRFWLRFWPPLAAWLAFCLVVLGTWRLRRRA